MTTTMPTAWAVVRPQADTQPDVLIDLFKTKYLNIWLLWVQKAKTHVIHKEGRDILHKVQFSSMKKGEI